MFIFQITINNLIEIQLDTDLISNLTTIISVNREIAHRHKINILQGKEPRTDNIQRSVSRLNICITSMSETLCMVFHCGVPFAVTSYQQNLELCREKMRIFSSQTKFLSGN